LHTSILLVSAPGPLSHRDNAVQAFLMMNDSSCLLVDVRPITSTAVACVGAGIHVESWEIESVIREVRLADIAVWIENPSATPYPGVLHGLVLEWIDFGEVSRGSSIVVRSGDDKTYRDVRERALLRWVVGFIRRDPDEDFSDDSSEPVLVPRNEVLEVRDVDASDWLLGLRLRGVNALVEGDRECIVDDFVGVEVELAGDSGSSSDDFAEGARCVPERREPYDTGFSSPSPASHASSSSGGASAAISDLSKRSPCFQRPFRGRLGLLPTCGRLSLRRANAPMPFRTSLVACAAQ